MSREYRNEFIEHVENCGYCMKFDESENSEEIIFKLQSECYEDSK